MTAYRRRNDNAQSICQAEAAARSRPVPESCRRCHTSFPDNFESQKPAAPLPDNQKDSLTYLAAVLHGQIKSTDDLSALDTNIIVMQILDAARTSAKTGRTIELTPLPQSP